MSQDSKDRLGFGRLAEAVKAKKQVSKVDLEAIINKIRLTDPEMQLGLIDVAIASVDALLQADLADEERSKIQDVRNALDRERMNTVRIVNGGKQEQ